MGDDALGAAVIAPGARCLADLTALFGDGRELRLPARDIGAGGEVVLE